MKKLLYILFVITLATSTFTACTEDEVKPAGGGNNGGGIAIKE
jgi:hypothetical protein